MPSREVVYDCSGVVQCAQFSIPEGTPRPHADMDAVYFQLGTLIQTEQIPGANFDLSDAETLSWGHAMKSEKVYAQP